MMNANGHDCVVESPMPLKRSHSSASSSDSNALSDQNTQKRVHADSHPLEADTQESAVDQHPLKVYIISAKLQPGVLENLVSLVEKAAKCGNEAGTQTFELTADLDLADVVVTAVRTRPRLERHISGEVAKTKAIVTPDWLKHSISSGTVQPCGKYAALSDLRDQTDSLYAKAETGSLAPHKTSSIYYGQVLLDPEDSVKDTDLAALDHLSPFCCQRPSHLICPNQALVEELDIIRRARFFEGEEQSMLSYARAIAIIKAYPHRFNGQTSREDITKLPYLGAKLTSMVEEFIKTGKISEAQNLLSSTRFLSLSAFNGVHGIGPHTARHLYSIGLRTLEDVEKYYEVAPGMTHEGNVSHFEERTSKVLGVEKSIQISLTLRHDFSQKISRQEAEEINQVITRELGSIETGYKSIIVGGYRRGKLESNDVDIVISHTDWDRGADKVRGLRKKLMQKLQERGIIKHVLFTTDYHPHNVFHTHHWDILEKAFTVFALPYDAVHQRTYRRVDLIFVPPDVFWTAVVGWTGSTMFQRDLRLWAKKKRGIKFDSSGITRQHDSILFHPKSEREVFELLGLTYVHPTLRNADA